MKKFKFRLEPVLKLRQQQEDAKKRVVGALLQDIYTEQQRALELAAALREEGEELKRQYQSGQVDLEWIGHYFRYAHQVQQAIGQRVNNVTVIQKRLNEARNELVHAARQRRILSKLKEKRRQRYMARLRRLEAIEQDEIGTQRYIRRRGRPEEMLEVMQQT